MGCHFLIQGIFPTQESNLWPLHWQADFFLTVSAGNPLIQKMDLNGLGRFIQNIPSKCIRMHIPSKCKWGLLGQTIDGDRRNLRRSKLYTESFLITKVWDWRSTKAGKLENHKTCRLNNVLLNNYCVNKEIKGYGVKGTLMYCWWNCKLVQIIWRILYQLSYQGSPEEL